jgi:hypothetical protein
MNIGLSAKAETTAMAEQVFHITGNSEGNSKTTFMSHIFIFLQYIIIIIFRLVKNFSLDCTLISSAIT